jgi:hypothetical protein
MEFSIDKDDSSKLPSSDSSKSSLRLDVMLLPLPKNKTASMDDAILLDFSVLSLSLQIALELQLLLSSPFSDDESSFHPKIGLASEMQSLISSLSSDNESLSLHPKIGLTK